MLRYLRLCFAWWAVFAHATCNTAAFLEVDTSNGPITGHIAPNSTCVVEYLGVTYAKPPVGSLRFAPPEKLADQVPYDALKFGFDCPLTPSKKVDYPDMTPQAQQIIAYFASGAGTPQSEDCLTLNIWSKTTHRSFHAGKPVLVFFYGGRFTIGNTNTPFYHGGSLADAQDMVVVTVNYRLNIFGFPGSPELPAQNLGLRDQRAAVEWLRDNIASFGGDPTKITLAGQSSGAVAIDYWAFAYRDDPIAQSLIMHSGTALSFPTNPPSTTAQNWHKAASAAGCANATSALACMRAVPWETLRAAAAAVPAAASRSVLRAVPPFYPAPDNYIVFADYPARAARGAFARLPVLLGRNVNEAGYYRVAAYGKGDVPTPAQVEAFHAESFVCPVAFAAATRRKWGVPVWGYAYAADWENTRLYPGSGAYHGVDIHMLFGNAELVSGLPVAEEQVALMRRVRGLWSGFVEDPWRGLEGLGWPWWEEGKETMVVLGEGERDEARLVRVDEFEGMCGNVTLGSLGE